MEELYECPHCGVTFPRNAAYFRKDPYRKDGMCRLCKTCESKRVMAGEKPISERRFLKGIGERFLKNGKIRCQAVTRGAMRSIRAEQGPDVRAKDFFPEYQCHRPAVAGMYVCKYHGGGSTGDARTLMSQVRNITKYLNKNLADKYLESFSDDQLFNQRTNVSLVNARNMQLLEDMQAGGLTTTERLKALRKGLKLLDEGEVVAGAATIRNVVESLTEEKSAWDEIRKNVEVIKDLSNAEMTRRKEMRQYLTAEQVVAKLDEFTNRVLDAIEKQVDNPQIIEGIYREIVGAAHGAIGTPGNALLATYPISHGEDLGESG